MTYITQMKSYHKKMKIIDIIKQGEIHHNELIRTILDNGLMAKKTAEKNITSLIEENFVDSYKLGNKLFYSIKPILDHYDLELANQIEPLTLIIQSMIDQIVKDYEVLTVENKIFRLSHIFMLIFRAINCCAVLDAIKNPKSKESIKYEIDLKMKIRKLLELITNNSDSKTVYSIISESFSPIQRPKEMQLR